MSVCGNGRATAGGRVLRPSGCGGECGCESGPVFSPERATGGAGRLGGGSLAGRCRSGPWRWPSPVCRLGEPLVPYCTAQRPNLVKTPAHPLHSPARGLATPLPPAARNRAAPPP
eukprot:scaffold2562_cov354-Prasinococcus_capsulatus_cf.AAC.8